MLGEQRDVFGALAQRRQGDNVEGQPVEQIASEAAGCGERRQVDVGRGDDTDIDVVHLVAADPLEAAIFDDAQDLLLHRQRGDGDLVEEQGATIGDLEAREAAAGGAREGARLMAEELAVEQAFGECSAIEFDEGLVPARREKGEARHNQLLAGATLAHDQCGPVECRKLRDLGQGSAEGGRLADQ